MQARRRRRLPGPGCPGTPGRRDPHLDDRLQRGGIHDGGADEGVGILGLAVDFPHGEDHGDGEEEGGDPDAADKLLGAAAGHDALGFEGVADGHVALHAEAGDVERRGVGAGVPEEVVAFADGSPESPGVMDPDEVVELDGHAEEEDEEVGEGEAGQVVVHGALQVLQRLLANQRVRRDGVTHGAHQEESQVDDGHHHFGVDVGVDVQVLLVRPFGQQVGAVGRVGIAAGLQVEGPPRHGRVRGVQVHPRGRPGAAARTRRYAPTCRCPRRGNLARFNAAGRRRLPLPGCRACACACVRHTHHPTTTTTPPRAAAAGSSPQLRLSPAGSSPAPRSAPAGQEPPRTHRTRSYGRAGSRRTAADRASSRRCLPAGPGERPLGSDPSPLAAGEVGFLAPARSSGWGGSASRAG